MFQDIGGVFLKCTAGDFIHFLPVFNQQEETELSHGEITLKYNLSAGIESPKLLIVLSLRAGKTLYSMLALRKDLDN